MPLLHRQLIHKSNKAMESPSVMEIFGGLVLNWDQMTGENSLTFFIRQGSQDRAHAVPIIQSLLKKPQVLSGPRKETSWGLRNNNSIGPIIQKPALIFCAKSIGFYQNLIFILVKSTATSSKHCRSVLNMFVAIFCLTCTNFWYRSVLRSQEIKGNWHSWQCGKVITVSFSYLRCHCFPTKQIAYHRFRNACLLGTKRVFRTFFSLTCFLEGGIFFYTIKSEQHRSVSFSFFNLLRKQRWL